MKPNKENSFLDLSKLCEENQRKIAKLLDENINRIEEFPILFWNNSEWDQLRRDDTDLPKQELTYTQFLEMMGGETSAENSEVERIRRSAIENLVLMKIDKKMEHLNEIEVARIEGVLTGLKMCKEMWAQGTISHENIQEEIYHYQEELDNLKSNN